MKHNIPCISIVGTSNTGKTTVIEGLIPLFRNKGLRVATIKHHHLDFEIDKEGKDTYRHKSAGASLVLLSSPRKIAFIKSLETEMSLKNIVARYVDDVDLIITEGYKKEDIPKIEVFRYGKGRVPLYMRDRTIRAVVTDRPLNADIPQFSSHDFKSLAAFINTVLDLGTGVPDL